MPDTLHLIIWLVGGIAGSCAVGELFKERYDLGLGVSGYGALGGVTGALILQTLIPALKRIDYGPIVGPADSDFRQWGRPDCHRGRSDPTARKQIASVCNAW